jgi:hypothetical protein
VSQLGKLDAHMEYSTNREFAAVLLARPFLVKHMVDNELFFENWARENFATERKKHEAIEKYGLVVIFKTCSAPYCAITTFGGATKSVSVGFSGGAYTPGANAKLEASGDWYLEGKSGVWRVFGHWEQEKVENEKVEKEEYKQEQSKEHKPGVKGGDAAHNTPKRAEIQDGKHDEDEEEDEDDDLDQVSINVPRSIPRAGANRLSLECGLVYLCLPLPEATIHKGQYEAIE